MCVRLLSYLLNCQFEQCKINKWKIFAISLFTSLPQFVIDVQNDFHFSKWQCALYWVSNVTDFPDFFFWYTFFKLISLRSYRIEWNQSAKDISPYIHDARTPFQLILTHSAHYWRHMNESIYLNGLFLFIQTTIVQCISRTFDSISLHCDSNPKMLEEKTEVSKMESKKPKLLFYFFKWLHKERQ